MGEMTSLPEAVMGRLNPNMQIDQIYKIVKTHETRGPFFWGVALGGLCLPVMYLS